jgi:hypothetical protein
MIHQWKDRYDPVHGASTSKALVQMITESHDSLDRMVKSFRWESIPNNIRLALFPRMLQDWAYVIRASY